MCGDFNINLLEINSNTHYDDYFESIYSKGFFPRIALPTRIQPPFSLIDNILRNSLDDGANKFIDELASLNILDKLDKGQNTDPNNNYELLAQLIKYAREKHIPRVKVRYHKKKHQRSKWLKYSSRRFTIVCKTKLQHKKQIREEFSINNQLVIDPEVIANSFNEYFVSIGRKLAEKIQPVQRFSSYLNVPSETVFNFVPVTEQNISDIIKNLKNKSSYEHDCLSNILIKKVQNVLIEPLTFLINQSLSTDIFPNELKISLVKPLYKSGNASLLSNYRPISVLFSISKVYEYVVFKQLLNYMECNQLFYTDHYGSLYPTLPYMTVIHQYNSGTEMFLSQILKGLDQKCTVTFYL